jgi:hypothetical protein
MLEITQIDWNAKCSCHLREASPLRHAGPGLCAAALPAATLERLSLDEMIVKSTAIVRGKVLNSFTAAEWAGVLHPLPDSSQRHTQRAGARNGGNPVARGSGRTTCGRHFAGVPQFNAGDEYIFFLWTGKSGATQVLGLTQGLFLGGPGRCGRSPDHARRQP